MRSIPLTEIEQTFKERQGAIPSGAELAGGYPYIVLGSVRAAQHSLGRRDSICARLPAAFPARPPGTECPEQQSPACYDDPRRSIRERCLLIVSFSCPRTSEATAMIALGPNPACDSSL